MTSNAQSWNTKYILLSNFGSKHSLVMKFGQFMKYYKMQLLSKKYIKNVSLVCKRHKHHILTSETMTCIVDLFIAYLSFWFQLHAKLLHTHTHARPSAALCTPSCFFLSIITVKIWDLNENSYWVNGIPLTFSVKNHNFRNSSTRLRSLAQL